MYLHSDVQDKGVLQVQGIVTLNFLSQWLSATGTDYRPI